jgi:inner membrane protein
MDNLTHSLLGVALARAGLGRLAPRANWVVVAAANAPDLDAISWAGGSLAYLDVHRGWTHSFLLAPLVALAPLALWRLLVRKPEQRAGRWLGACVAALAGVVSHHLLDWLNVYGVRLLAPWRGDWFRLDWVNIIDIWLWAMLLVGVLAPMLSGLVSSEIGARKGTGKGWAWFTLALLAAYLGGRAYLHAQAAATLEARQYPNGAVLRAAAFPTAFNPFEWVGLVETDSVYRVYQLNLLREFDPEGGRVFYKAGGNPAVEIARQSGAARRFLAFSQFPAWTATPEMDPPEAVRVDLSDLRFGKPEEGRFRVRMLVQPRRGVLEESFTFGPWERTGRR